MKRIILIATLIFISKIGFAQEFKTEIKSATVYLNKAQVMAESQVTILPGTSVITLTNIAAYVDNNSIQIGAKDDFTLLGIKYMPDYGNKPVNKNADALEALIDELSQKKLELEIAESEKAMILANSNVKGEDKGLVKNEFGEMIDYFRLKLTEVGKRKLSLEKEIKAINEKLKILNQENQNRRDTSTLGKIELTVESARNMVTTLEVAYLVNQASWQPNYDLKVTENVNLVSRANVYQNSGLDWKNIDLTLSSYNPSVNSTKPELYPQYLRFNSPRIYSARNMMKASAGVEMEMVADAPAAPEVIQVESTFATEYKIDKKYDILNGNTPTSVQINEADFNSDFTYFASPKMSKNVYLTAGVKDFESQRILPGEANVFYEGKLVNKTFVNGETTDNTLDIGLGIDKRIQLKREEKNNYKNRRTLGSNITQDFSYEITVKNTKSESIVIVIEDQVPVSQDSDIVVNVESIDKAKEEENGKLVWNLTLKPNETKVLKVSYSVKYPKNKRIYNL